MPQRRPQAPQASNRMMELCDATAPRQLSPWRMPSTPRLDACIAPRPRRDSPKGRPHHGSQSEALSRQRRRPRSLAAAENAIIPQNHQIVSISPRAGQGALAPVRWVIGGRADCRNAGSRGKEGLRLPAKASR
jgi:hypothetical protein